MGKGKHGGSGTPAKGEEGYVQPPDGGWGWVVVFSSFLIHVIADGIVYSFGVFLVEFIEVFKSGRGETSWVASLQPAVTFTVGPLASALTNKYGCRVVTIAGSIIGGTGFVLSMFAPNLYYLYFSCGIMAGIGFGLIYLPAIVSVAQYFEKRRSFATGLAVCGSGFGTFIMAPLTKFLLQEYGWRGAILIIGGILLNGVVCGAVFRPLVGPVVSPSTVDRDAGVIPESEHLLGPPQTKKESGERIVVGTDTVDMKKLLDTYAANGAGDASTLLTRDVPQNTGVRLLSSSQTLTPPSNGLVDIAMSDGALHRMNRPPQELQMLRQQSMSASTTSSIHPVSRKDVFYSGSLQNIPMFRSNHDQYITSITSIHTLDESDESETKCCGVTVSSEFKDAFRQMMDFSLLKNPVFLLFAISNFFTSIGFNMPFIFLPDRAKLTGIDEGKAAWLLSAIGIANTLGRVVFGFLADLRWVNRLMLYNTALTICGVATALSPFVGGNYELLMVYSAVFGIFIGVYVSLTSVVLVDLLGIELLTNSFGLLLLFQGAATFVGPPIAGWMCDWTGSYDISFHVMGFLIALSGAMLYFLPCVERRYEKKQPRQETIYQIEMGKHTSDPEAMQEAEMQMNDMHARKTSL